MSECPSCGEVLNGENRLGHNVRGVYDGVLVWQCLKCGHAWPRFTAPGDPPARVAAAAEYAAVLNEDLSARRARNEV